MPDDSVRERARLLQLVRAARIVLGTDPDMARVILGKIESIIAAEEDAPIKVPRLTLFPRPRT